MPLLLGWRSSARGQSPRQRDTHGMAAAQLLLEEFERRQTRHSGSLGSFWWAVQREGTGRELGEPQGASSLLSGSSARELPAAVGAPLPSWGAVFPPRTAPPGASPRAVSTGPPGCTARQGLPQERADPELLQRPGAAEREEKQPECPLLPSLRAEAGAGTALPRGARHSGRRKPCRGAGQRRCPALPWDVAPRLTGK